MAPVGDQAAREHIDGVRHLYEQAGVVRFIHEVVQEVWAANRRRWSPRRHYDDANTLGYQTSRNVSNRLLQTFDESAVAPYVAAESELGVTVLAAHGYRLRVVKAAIECGLNPDFDDDFDWRPSATRAAAAQRNSSNYLPMPEEDWTLKFETDPRPSRLRQVQDCRDFFLVWAAEMDSDRTAGWLGMPRSGDHPWMGIVDLWVDDERPSQSTEEADAADEDEEPD
ncbi:hypothetical protein KMZ32_05635 [Phycicoccus sp. MAQZ13P-2]|uniref:hypothetical protein n=1 Tax=Phycicoccus mangrovi TaxID=2840470 RepID=UPI001C0066B8|nr:hypothetical protein [Phycicoccus mangrovi]MBT9273558.1 hypothetical protein [Phycicoccus mangrovi]